MKFNRSPLNITGIVLALASIIVAIIASTVDDLTARTIMSFAAALLLLGTAVVIFITVSRAHKKLEAERRERR